MDVHFITDRKLGFTEEQWMTAARSATDAGHRRGSHSWWDHIRDELGIPRDCCQ